MIPHLVAHFLAEFAARGGRPVYGIAAQALRVLETYPWPGNIRELRNVIERAVALSAGPEIQLADLPEIICQLTGRSGRNGSTCRPELAVGGSASRLDQVGGEAEAARTFEALRKHDNNRSRAARELGISRRTLYKKLHRYGLMETPRQAVVNTPLAAKPDPLLPLLSDPDNP